MPYLWAKTQSLQRLEKRFFTLLIAVFAAMATLLSLVGIYGVVTYGVRQGTREFGIRVAPGSTRQSTLLLVLRDAAWMALVGIAVGLGQDKGRGARDRSTSGVLVSKPSDQLKIRHVDSAASMTPSARCRMAFLFRS